jgi:hypothetical protein
MDDLMPDFGSLEQNVFFEVSLKIVAIATTPPIISITHIVYLQSLSYLKMM